MNPINVLIFPAGEINSIELHDALSSCVNINVYGASSNDRHGGFIFKNYINNIPYIYDDTFIFEFNALIDKLGIDVVFPTHDSVAEFLAEHAEDIHAKVLPSNKRTAAICRDKKKTYDLFADTSFVPRLYSQISTFPVFIKPREGQGGVGAKLIERESDIPAVHLEDYVICEYLPGREYTVDCLTDHKGTLQVVSPRSRQRIMAGISVAGKNEEATREIRDIAETINSRLSFLGLWWFQIRQDLSGKWKLLEISTRCAGTMGLTRATGINLPLLSVYAAMGYDLQITPNQCAITMDRALISRYRIDYQYNNVYIDYDDTITLHGKINLKAIWFLYQCQNNGVKMTLLTRHKGDLYSDMKKRCIDLNLFTDIILIGQDKEKTDYICSEKAIFIDNAYQERKKVSEKLHIPVFDVDGIEVLMDWTL